MTTGAIILAGGRGSRMGCDKALLRFNGETYLQRLLRELQDFREVIISVDRPDRFPQYQALTVPDRYPGTGPIGGLYSALSQCQSEAMLTVCCDMPLFQRELGEFLLSYLSPEWDALVTEDRAGRVHPLCGVYRKQALAPMLEQIRARDLKMTNLLERLRVKRVKLRHSAFSDACVWNVNRPSDQIHLAHGLPDGGPAVIAVSGVKNSGKTTLLEKLLPLLRDLGYCTAVVKHDGHDFTPDVPGTDSDRLRRAGAVGTAVFSRSQCLISDQTPGRSESHFIRYFHRADLILLEGFKHSPYPKIEVIRRGVSDRPVSAPDTWLAVMTDTAFQAESAPTLDIDDAAAAADIIDRYLRSQGRCPRRAGP